MFISVNSSQVDANEQMQVIGGILELYPDVPALGSPFGTGNETFGLNSEFKRASAIQGDVAFTSLRRQLAQNASAAGVKVFAYLFTDPQTDTYPAYLGGKDLDYLVSFLGDARGLSYLLTDGLRNS